CYRGVPASLRVSFRASVVSVQRWYLLRILEICGPREIGLPTFSPTVCAPRKLSILPKSEQFKEAATSQVPLASVVI
ncbi:MAG: hypothetical protein JZU65_16530, partial [Chlorobium sp.]|nr:hypothetical protein [Chlorobium sp.]